MGELWRDLVDVLRRFPVLWLPVLVADLLGYLVNLGSNALVHAMLVHQVQQHSVLGGSAVNTPLSSSVMQKAAVIALLLSWLSNFARLLLYGAALIATAALLWAKLAREPKPGAAVGPALREHWSGLLDLALRALAVYAVVALGLSWLTGALARSGHGAVLRNAWFGFGSSLLVLLLLAVLLTPVALRVLAGRSPDAARVQVGRGFAMTMVVVAAVLALFTTGNSRALAQIGIGARIPLEIVGSLTVALPYVLLYTGMALLARQVRREADTTNSA